MTTEKETKSTGWEHIAGISYPKKGTPKLCEVCKKIDKDSDKCLCVECFKKWLNISSVEKKLIRQKLENLKMQVWHNDYMDKKQMEYVEECIDEQFKELL